MQRPRRVHGAATRHVVGGCRSRYTGSVVGPLAAGRWRHARKGDEHRFQRLRRRPRGAADLSETRRSAGGCDGQEHFRVDPEHRAAAGRLGRDPRAPAGRGQGPGSADHHALAGVRVRGVRARHPAEGAARRLVWRTMDRLRPVAHREGRTRRGHRPAHPAAPRRRAPGGRSPRPPPEGRQRQPGRALPEGRPLPRPHRARAATPSSWGAAGPCCARASRTASTSGSSRASSGASGRMPAGWRCPSTRPAGS